MIQFADIPQDNATGFFPEGNITPFEDDTEGAMCVYYSPGTTKDNHVLTQWSERFPSPSSNHFITFNLDNRAGLGKLAINAFGPTMGDNSIEMPFSEVEGTTNTPFFCMGQTGSGFWGYLNGTNRTLSAASGSVSATDWVNTAGGVFDSFYWGQRVRFDNRTGQNFEGDIFMGLYLNATPTTEELNQTSS